VLSPHLHLLVQATNVMAKFPINRIDPDSKDLTIVHIAEALVHIGEAISNRVMSDSVATALSLP
jgi:hypothetical protein